MPHTVRTPFGAGSRARLASTATAFAVLLGGCESTATQPTDPAAARAQWRTTTHAQPDDLLTAGLGEAGLRSPLPPAFVDPNNPTAAELRRRAIWSNWRGIADLAPGGGYGEFYGSFQAVPGREFQALRTLPGHQQPHRVLVQLPDNFDQAARCVVVTAASGSRGIYGAIALAGAWGLPRGCAVAYTDKGAGTGYVDTTTGVGIGLDGLPAADGQVAEFQPAPAADGASAAIAVKHAHSGDNPEAAWGEHLHQAADFALQVLASSHPNAGPWTYANTRVVAVGVSNGGAAVLQGAARTERWLSGAVAISPNIWPAAGGRALFDTSTEAAIWMPCALNAAAFDSVLLARPGGAKHPAGAARCASLHAAGDIDASSADAQAEAAHAHLRAAGWSDAALAAGALSTGFDLWRAVNVTYAAAYARRGAHDMPCGYRFAAMGPDGVARAPTAAERAAWWSDASGIPPGAGVGIVDSMATTQPSDPSLPGLRCLRALWTNGDPTVQASVAATRGALPLAELPVIVIHGANDGLIPAIFSSDAYALSASQAGRPLRYWRVEHAQHFDAFLGLPVLAVQYVPLMPYAYRALDAMWAHIVEGAALPADARIEATPRKFVDGAVAPLTVGDLGMVE